MKNKGRPSPPMISSLIFVIQPLRVTFSYPQSATYSIQFDRGKQTIKKYAQALIFPKDGLDYHFSTDKTDMIKLKLQSEHDLDFQWELYKIQDKVSAFAERIPINLMEFYRIYVHSIIKSGIDFEKMKEQLRKGQFQVRRWEIDRENLQWQFAENMVKNVGMNVQIAYRLQIWNQFDIFCEASHQKIQKITSESGSGLFPNQQSQHQGDYDDIPQNLQFDPCQSPKQAQSSPQSPKGTHKRRYFQAISMLKRNSALSEIIECSNETSSIINYGQRCIELDIIQGIPEEQNEQSPYIQSVGQLRRSNTIESGFNHFPPLSRRSRKKLSTPQRKYSEIDEKDSFGRMETGLQILIQAEGKQNRPLTSRLSPKLIIVAMIFLLAIGYLVYSRIERPKTNKKPLKKAQKKSQKSQPSIKVPKKQKEGVRR